MIRFEVGLAQLGWALSHWWNRQDQFEWFGSYLGDRQLIEPTRVLLAISAGAVTLVPLVTLLDTATRPGFGFAAAVVASVLGVALSLMWLVLPWPSADRSRWWVIGSDVAIALACVAREELIGGLSGCALFGLVGGYIAFFHGARMLTAHIAFTFVVAGTLAGLLLGDDQAAVSTIAVAVIQAVLVGIAIPIATQFVLEMLASDAAASEVDTLTGVLNRRGLERALERITSAGRQNAHGLAVLVADLDNFKEINDRYGHRHGDRVLAEIAARLRGAVGASGVVARIGGDEFVVADSLRWTEPTRLANHVLHTIAAVSDPPVTASVGVVHLSGRIPGRQSVMSTVLFTDLADAAMYEAKRSGGNTVRTRSHHYA
ncbi:GGDEF domain-containing protein [Williamsia sp.]|uniref:GGDEF domain-containing protein n=1 Tax=Williamsia sp. TaxID=1872085 RepID=UPI001A32FF9F|nr:GGDEF domain-containing protein [Williamsia sp.]MBJ7287754.1 GGDEF domain-containing protein [Williamsia sp.]